MIGSSLLWDMMWLSASVIKKQSCIRYSKSASLGLKCVRMRLAAGLRPHPQGELEHSPRPPSRNWGERCLLLRGREGKLVRDLGILIDADLVMRTHVQKTVSRCFAVLRQLCSIRHSVPATTFQTLIASLVLSRLDCGNAVLAGLPGYLFRRLQSVMNAAARLIYGLRHSDHISDALISLHWLPA